ncbi:MAG TPA: sterol desaturase family protein [Burkholderiales bacterium]|nr:sterol desaturase family protein [Burkholderiales bacterium]
MPDLLPRGPFWWPLFWGAAIFGFRYLAFAGLAFAAWYGRREAPPGKLQAAMPGLRQLGREIAYSVVAVLIFGLVNALLAGYGILAHTRLYTDVAQHGWAWFWLSIPLMILVHDAYFYWTHRLMHTRPLFRAFHAVHHLSTNPTPWTAYSFHPLESAVQALGVVLIIFVMPSHPLALILFQTISTAINVYGHLGYEIYPRDFSRHWLGRWINTSTAHNRHHKTARHNYGFYFLFWDRLMGTLEPSYEARYVEARGRGVVPARV